MISSLHEYAASADADDTATEAAGCAAEGSSLPASLSITTLLESLICPFSFLPKNFTSSFCPETIPAFSGDAIFLMSSSETWTSPSYPGKISTKTPKL